jgi:hypothetical protein
VITLFNSLIRSKFEFASLVWSPSCQNSKLTVEKLQKKMDKYLFFKGMIPNAPPEFNYLSCSKILGIETLERRRIMADLILVLDRTN